MKKAIAILLSLVMMGMLAGCGGPPAVTNENYWIALITENQTDPRWLEMEDGAAKAGSELAVQVFQLSPAAEGEENNGEQHFADQVHEAISGGYHAIVAAPDGTEAVSAALQDAVDAGLKLIYVDSSAEAEAAAAFATDFRAAGKAAGEAMLDALTARRITEGEIGMIGADADDASAAELEAGFREVLESREYVLTETFLSPLLRLYSSATESA